MPFAADLPLLLVDARGEGRLQLFYGGPDGRTAECNGIFVARDGTVRAGGAGGTGSGEPWPAIPLNALVSMSSGGSGGGAGGMDEQHVAGRAGLAVSRVHVSAFGVADPIEATVANGWWAAWWPGDAPCRGAVALAADGSVLSSLPSC